MPYALIAIGLALVGATGYALNQGNQIVKQPAVTLLGAAATLYGLHLVLKEIR